MALQLEVLGNHRALVTLVETWAEQGAPTVPARLAEARSFIALRMLDRAWVRLKDLVECAEPNVDALGLAAEMFLLRGWPNQAKRVIQRGLERAPHDPALVLLQERALEAPTAVDDSAGDGDSAPTGELVRVAEHHMARGAFVRARTLLERVRRRTPDHPWATDLLWAMQGELTASESLSALCERWSPDVTVELPDEPEHTESARLDDLRAPEHDAAFPRLFRNLDPPDGAGSAVELTDVSSMAEVGELSSMFGDKTDHGDDTQIARVMHKGGAEAQVHIGTTNIDSGFNLADFRREMGMSSPELDSDFHAGPEDEDDSVVIHTGRGEDDATQDVSDAKGRLARDAAHEKLAASKAKRATAEDAWVGPARSAEGAEPAARAAPSRTTPASGSPAPAPKPVAKAVPVVPRSAPVRPAEAPEQPGPGDITQAKPRPPAPRVRGVPQRPVVVWPNPPGSNSGTTWPYWLAAIAAVLAFFVLLFAVISVVLAIA